MGTSTSNKSSQFRGLGFLFHPTDTQTPTRTVPQVFSVIIIIYYIYYNYYDYFIVSTFKSSDVSLTLQSNPEQHGLNADFINNTYVIDLQLVLDCYK